MGGREAYQGGINPGMGEREACCAERYLSLLGWLPLCAECSLP